MKQKKKICKQCGRETNIYASKCCLPCYKLQNPEKFQIKRTELKKTQTKIKPVSDKQKKRLDKYFELRDIYLKEHPICEFKGCNSKEVDLHHKGLRTGDNLYRHFMSCCRYHHSWIHEHPIQSKEKGYLL